MSGVNVPLSHLGYNPIRNEAGTGFRFNFNMELAVCHIDEDSMLVTFVVPCVIRNDGEDYSEAVRCVNSRNLRLIERYLDDLYNEYGR